MERGNDGGEKDDESEHESDDMSAEGTVIDAHAWREIEPPGQEALVRDLEAETARITDQITTRIQTEFEAYAGPSTGKRHWLIGMATRAAFGQFTDALGGGLANSRKVDDLFAKMGYGEASDGHELELILAALDRAAVLIWDEVRALAVALDSSAATLSHAADVLRDQMGQLREQVRTGYREGRRAEEAASVRTRTLDTLLTRPQKDLVDLAGQAGWSVPDRLVVVTALRTERAGSFAPKIGDHLSNEGNPLVIALDAALAPDLIEYLGQDETVTRAAASWPMSPREAFDAFKWTRRLLDLAHRGVVPDDKVLNCADHRTQLWLHSEPALRRQLCQELLPPLLAETPNSREILSETLLAWLETRDSAPAIAARLAVHPQTIRYRWKRINQLFGKALHDPDMIVQLTLLLTASVPMWKAGDQSDFDRFNTESGD